MDWKGKFFAFSGLVIAGVLAYGTHYAWVKVDDIMRAQKVPDKITPRDLGWDYEEFSLRVSGLTVKGWLIPNKGNIACIFAPGYDGNRSLFLRQGFRHTVKAFYGEGYVLVLFDPRGLGESGGELYALGAFEDEDIIAVMRYLKKKGIKGFILFGVSAGASAVIRAAARWSKEEILCVIADSPFAIPDWTEVYPPFWVKAFKLIARLRFGKDLMTKLDIRSDAQRVSRVFFVVGEKDRTTLPRNALLLFRMASPPKELWVVPGADHVQAASLYPQEYDGRILEFIKRCQGL